MICTQLKFFPGIHFLFPPSLLFLNSAVTAGGAFLPARLAGFSAGHHRRKLKVIPIFIFRFQ
jgi:hypothetical protein